MPPKSLKQSTHKPSGPWWRKPTLFALLVLLTGCASVHKPQPVVCPTIPPLPPEAKQIASPTLSADLEKLLDELLPQATTPSTGGLPAKGRR